MRRCRLLLIFLLLGLSSLACSDDEEPTIPPTLVNHYDAPHEWECAQDVSCQDVFNIAFTAGTTVTFEVTDLSGDSIAQLALYAPGVALGETNLLTGTTNELRCNFVGNCGEMPDQVVTDFALTDGGTYRLAVTRDWGVSCGGSGTFRLVINADSRFEFPVRTVNDAATLATGTECP